MWSLQRRCLGLLPNSAICTKFPSFRRGSSLNIVKPIRWKLDLFSPLSPDKIGARGSPETLGRQQQFRRPLIVRPDCHMAWLVDRCRLTLQGRART